MASMRRTSIALFLATLVIATGCPQMDATAHRSGDRVTRAAGKARERLDATLKKKGVAFGDELFIRVFKEEAELETWLLRGKKFALLKTYPICAYSGELGPKEKQGDEQAPEGFYSVGPSKLNPQSSYHLSFDVGYPNAYDRALGRTGNLIMVHGACVSIGCFAMTNDGIEDIYSLAHAALANGQKFIRVHIFPFRMTARNMKRHAPSKWSAFWANLKEGYDLFESDRLPPDVVVKDARYLFTP